LKVLDECEVAIGCTILPGCGRLMFLAYEATTRRRPDPKVEAQVHAVGLFMMLALVLVVTFVVDIPGRGH